MDIQSIFRETFVLLEQRFWKFFSIALPLVIFSLFFLPFSNDTLAEHTVNTGGPNLQLLLGWLVSLAMYLIVAVKCHKIFLKNASVNVKDYFVLNINHLNFLFGTIKISLIYMLLFMPLVVFWENMSGDTGLGIDYTDIVFHLMTLLTGIAFSRIALILPAAALGDKLSMLESWQLTGQNKVAAFVLFAALPIFTTWLLEFIPTEENILLESLEILMWFLVSLFELGLLSVYYKNAKENKEEPSVLV